MPSMDTPSSSGTRHLWLPVLTPGCVAFLGLLVKSTSGTFWAVLPIWSHYLFSCVRAPASYYLSFSSPPSPRFLLSSLLFVGTLYIKDSRSMVCLPVFPILLVIHWWFFGIWEPFFGGRKDLFFFYTADSFSFFFPWIFVWKSSLLQCHVYNSYWVLTLKIILWFSF